MGPAQFVEFLIVGLNLFLLIAFLAWRLLGPGRPNYAQPSSMLAPKRTLPPESSSSIHRITLNQPKAFSARERHMQVLIADDHKIVRKGVRLF